MKTRKLGRTGVELTTIGLGTWAIGGGGWQFAWGAQDDTASIATIHVALDLGINWIDTAAVYGLGHAEVVVGKALREHREPVFIATKCGLTWSDPRHIGGCLRAASVKAECEASLQRLGVDVIDLYQIHWPDPEEEIEEAWDAIADLIAEGKVRYGGVSNFSIEHLQRVHAMHAVTSVQPPYSMLAREAESGLLDYCQEHGIGVVAYSPMQKGLLSGKMTQERVAAFEDDDHRKRDRMFLAPQLGRILDRVEELRAVASAIDVTLAQLAIAWVLRHSGMTAAIVGARRPDQIEETVGAADLELDEQTLAEIEAILAH